VYAWDLESQMHIASLQADNSVSYLAFSPLLDEILIRSTDGNLQIWTLNGNRLQFSFTGHTDTVAGVAYSPDGDLVASSSEDGVIVWDRTLHPVRRTMIHHPDSLIDGRFSPDGSRFVTRSENGTKWLWEARTGKPIRCLKKSSDYIMMGGDPQGSLFVGNDEIVFLGHESGIWSSSDGRRLGAPVHFYVTLGDSVIFSPDGRFCAVFESFRPFWNVSPALRLFEIRTGRAW
jgi:WD40 repeat protein